MANPLRIMIACGGTGGHVFPGLATAQVLRKSGCEVILLLAGKPAEQSALKDWDGPSITVSTRAYAGSSPLSMARTSWEAWRAAMKWRQILRAKTPMALLAMGCYASVGPVWAAHRLGVPVILHEANVVPGRAVRLLARLADAIALGFPEAAAHLRHMRLRVTGMPLYVPPDQGRAPPAGPPQWDWDDTVRTLLVMGGSAGAHALNKMLPQVVRELIRAGHRLQVIHLAGRADAPAVRLDYDRPPPVPALVMDFLDDMPFAYHRAALAVCRAGAATCAELAIYGVPALFIPYPHAAAGHQLANARVMAGAGAAELIQENTCSVPLLRECLAGMLNEPRRLPEMRNAMRQRARPDAAENLAELVLLLAGGG
ncbi:MAG: glycosyltransferase [Kiritimatiellia bacterium]|nr:UDP-N-acetylglucosamine--N-acetylmuramyl-(pentapeptide) pyrophosphoryl-undecaprenol N-acetylglucosamine transferase [Lentisphaerota bacterium]